MRNYAYMELTDEMTQHGEVKGSLNRVNTMCRSSC